MLSTTAEKKKNPHRGLILAVAREGSHSSLRELGLILAKESLATHGFTDLYEVGEEDRLDDRVRQRRRIAYGDILISKDGVRYITQIVTRRKYQQNGELNTRYILVRNEHAHEISGNPSPAERHYHAVPLWMAVRFDDNKYSIYLGRVSDLGGKHAIPMKESDLGHYECLALDALLDPD